VVNQLSNQETTNCCKATIIFFNRKTKSYPKISIKWKGIVVGFFFPIKTKPCCQTGIHMDESYNGKGGKTAVCTNLT